MKITQDNTSNRESAKEVNMFTKFFRRIKNGRSVVDTVDVADTTAATAPSTSATTDTDSGILYAVSMPGEPTVRLRAKNQTEVRAMARQAHGLKRLPAGTTVERLDG